MTEKDSNTQKRELIIPGLILCLAYHWTVASCAKYDLERLDIEPELAKSVLDGLSQCGMLIDKLVVGNREYPITSIIDRQECFRGAAILTDQGRLFCNNHNIKRWIGCWESLLIDNS